MGLPLWDLTESNPTRCDFAYPSNLLAALTDADAFLYEPHPKGLFKARQAIARYYEEKGWSVDEEHLLLTASTSEAYAFLFRLLLNPGDRVLVPRPSYPLLDFLADLNDVRLDAYPLVYDDSRWRIDMERLAAAICSDTRALVLINPNNPTGSVITLAEREALVELCHRHNLALISDEVFGDYLFPADVAGEPRSTHHSQSDDQRVPTLVTTSEVLTFTVSGVSKVLGLPQMKLAWIVVTGPAHLADEALSRLEIISDTYLSVSTPVQHALPRWMTQRNVLADQILHRLIANRTMLAKVVSLSSSCRLLAADGGWYAVLQLPGVEDEEEFALNLLDSDGVLVHPGYFFDFAEPGYVVISLLPPDEIFRTGVGKLIERLARG
ncbi:MAG TPA: pyridoxal phosphate-dependent aminotransferase [Blastocatellia bacterium]|nr:pyridoxal phosphate-dependent aminotransferase [Blastocatellia bacterium]